MALDLNVVEWFQEKRGITQQTLESFGVWTNDDGDVIFPYSSGDKVRPNPTQPLGERKRFSFSKGRVPSLFCSAMVGESNKAVFICEGETDTMRLWQELGGDTPVVGLGGINTWRREFVEELDQFKSIFVILDNDDDYEVAARVDSAWREIRSDLGPKARRINLPDGVKDVCEFFETFDLETLRLLAQKGRSKSRFRPLDLSIEPPEPSWLLEGLIAKGDVTLLSGAPGLGKSWITMALAVGVVEGYPSFLDHTIARQGRVLYVDEENPDDVVYSRLRRLGLTMYSNLRYIWNNGVRLDLTPDDLLDEALEFQPELIVLDSLTRIHSKEENAVGDMAPLMNHCIKPLARETGAAVMLIHHMDKQNAGPRGSVDIVASPDTTLNVYDTGVPGQFLMKLHKSRRRLSGQGMTVRITDSPDGGVHLIRAAQPEIPF